MELIRAAESIFFQLKGAIEKMSDDDYTRPISLLNQSTIGQHIRHTLEFFTCLQEGISNGTVNYDLRERDPALETDPTVAFAVIDKIMMGIQSWDWKTELTLSGSYEKDSDTEFSVPTNLAREFIYNIEHAIHHMALIKVGLKEIRPDLEIPNSFGVASSTLRYEKSKAL